jgi:hypothetical protein
MHKHLTLSLILLFLLLGCLSAFAQTSPAPSPYKDLMAAAGDAKDYEGQDLVLVFDSTYVDVDSTGLSHKRMHTLNKVLTPAGIAKLRAARFDYDPASNKIELLGARVHRKNGTVEELALSSALDLPQPTHLIYWGARMKVLPVPALEVGDALELEHRVVGFMIAYLASDGEEERYIPPMRGTYYDVIMFGSDVLESPTPPIKLKSYTISMPEDKPAQYESFNGEVNASMKFEKNRLVYHFYKENIPAYEEEMRAPGPSDVVTKVVFTSVKSWAEKSRWFYKVNEDRDIFGSDDAIRTEVAKITKDCKTDSCKFYALLHWVAQGIRYSGISMGKGEGYTLHPGTMTFRDRAGVCKDIAGMLVTMLRAAGYKDTYPVMTQAGARVEAIPADQFNHCVVATRRPDGSFLMLDPTWSPFNMDLWSRAETEQNIVIGSPKGEDLSQITKYTSEQNDFAFTMKSRLDESGNLTGTVHLQGKSYADARVRRPFSDAGQDQWDGICRTWLFKADPAAEMTKVVYGNLWDFDKPFTVDFDFRVPSYARVLNGRMDYEPFSQKLVWAGGGQMNVLTGLKKDRKQPLFTYNPRQVTIREILDLPAGVKVRKLPEARDIGGDLAYTKGGWKKSAGGLELSEVWHVRDRWVPLKDFDEVMKATNALKDHKALNVVLDREGGKR